MATFAAAALSSLASVGSAAVSGVSSLFGAGTAAAGGAATAAGIGSDAVAAGTASAGAAAASGGGFLSSLTTPSVFGSILQGGAGLMSAMGSLRQGQAQSNDYLTQANTAEMDAAQQDITTTTQDNSLKAQLVATLGQRDVAYAASGLDLSFGTPAVARAASIQDASAAVSTDDMQGAQNKARLMQRADLYKQMAGQAVDASDVTADGTLLATGAKILARG